MDISHHNRQGVISDLGWNCWKECLCILLIGRQFAVKYVPVNVEYQITFIVVYHFAVNYVSYYMNMKMNMKFIYEYEIENSNIYVNEWVS